MWRLRKVPDLRWALEAAIRCMLGLRIALLSALASLTSIMVIGPHHAAATYVGEPPERASGGTWFSKVLQLEVGLSFCVLVATSPDRHPAADPRRWRPAGGAVAGAGLAVRPPSG
jgi:hypothetical protein